MININEIDFEWLVKESECTLLKIDRERTILWIVRDLLKIPNDFNAFPLMHPDFIRVMVILSELSPTIEREWYSSYESKFSKGQL